MQTYQKAWCTVLLILSGISFSALAQTITFKAPADYNDYIVVEQTLIGKKIEAFNQTLATEDYKGAKKAHAELLTQIDMSTKKITELPDYKGNSELRKSAFELFVFYKMIIETDYAKIMQMAEKEGINDKTFARINGIFVSVQRDEAIMYGVFNKAQANFSQQFNMKLEENQLEKERREKSEGIISKPQ